MTNRYGPRVASKRAHAHARIVDRDGHPCSVTIYGDIASTGMIRYLWIVEITPDGSAAARHVAAAEESLLGGTVLGVFDDGRHLNFGLLPPHCTETAAAFATAALRLLGERFGYRGAPAFVAAADAMQDDQPRIDAQD